MIQLAGLSVRVGGFELRDITLDIPSGGYALVIGPTASGKTTLLEVIAGHVRPLAGRVMLHGQDVTHLPPERRQLGFVYQQYHLFPHLSVHENIGYGLGGRNGSSSRVNEVAELLRIEHLLQRGVRGLSGGEQQRVAIARAVAPRPRILLLDEPFASVDPSTRAILRRELRQVHEHEGITTLQVTHDFDDALRLGNLVAVLVDGRIAQHGRPEEVFRFPNSAFIARFVGSGNVIAGTVRRAAESNDEGRFAATFTSVGLSLDVVADREGVMHAVIRPEDLLLSADPLPPSVRNRFQATVLRCETLGPIVNVELDALGQAQGPPLHATVTGPTADELDLQPGRVVWLGLKATAVLLV